MLKRNLFFNSLLSISSFIFPLITFPFSSRILGPKGIGSVNFIDSFTQYFSLFAALGIPIYGVREISKNKHNQKDLNRTFSEIFFIHLMSSAIFCFIYLIAAFFIPSIKDHKDLVLVGITIIIFGVFAAEWLFIGIEQFAYLTVRTLIVRCLSVIFLFTFLKKDSQPLIYYLISASGTIITGLFNFYSLKKYVQIEFKDLNLRKHIKPLLVILSSTLAVSVYLLMDNIILGFIKGEVAVGLYSLAIRIVKMPFAFLGAIAAVIVPQVTRAYNENKIEEVQALLNKSFAFTCVVGIPVSIGLFISSPFLVDTFAGDAFSNSVTALKILVPVILLVGLNSIFATQFLTPIGKEKYMLTSVVIGMVVSIVINLCLIPLLSYVGAAIANVVTECIVTIFCLRYASKFIKLKFDSKIVLQSLAGSLLFIPTAIIVRGFNISYIFQEILVISLSVLLYICYLWFFVRNTYLDNIKAMVKEKVVQKFKPVV